MKNTFALILLLAAMAFACSPSANETDEPPQNISLDEDSTKMGIRLQHVTGHFTIGNEVMAFINCENNEGLYWIDDKTNLLNDKIKEIASPNSYKTYLVKISGTEKNKVEEELKGNFAKTIIVDSVISIVPRTHLNACLSPEFWADEAQWSLYISKDENVMEFYTKKNDVSYQFAYADPIVSKQTLVYTNQDSNNKIEITLKKNGCKKGYSAVVSLNNVAYNGCALKNEKATF